MPESGDNLHLEIRHVLFLDIVGYSTLLIEEQKERVGQLTSIVLGTKQVREATDEQLVRLPTGDGMALVFRHSPEEPARCALEIAEALRKQPELSVRMGIHSGPVSEVTDVSGRINIAGAGINMAQRVMDCGDAGHILLSQHVADDLMQYRQWAPRLRDLGECEVKHGVSVGIFNLYSDGLGNRQLPKKFQALKQRRARLRWVAGAAILLALGAIVALMITFPRGRRSVPAATDKSIAVLPFENLSDEQQNAYFTDGVQDEILTDLAKIAELKVISRTSVMQYKSGVRRNLREIAEQLGVAHVLEGSVQRTAGRVRVTAQLIDARTDAHLWAEHYDRPLDDVFAIQSEVAQAIADQLKAKLSRAEEEAIKRRPTTDLVAYDLFVRAGALQADSSFNARLKENLLEVTHLLEQAIARDATFFLAYCRLAEAHDLIYFFGSDHTPARLALANTAIQAALRLRPDSGEAHLALAQHLYRGYRDYPRALAELSLARRSLPNDPMVLELTSFIDRRQGRWEKSTRDLTRALELDPRNIFLFQQLSLTYELQRRYRDLTAILDRALKIVPLDPETLVARAMSDLAERADLQPIRETIEAVVSENSAAASTVADRWFYVALCERDEQSLSLALAAIPAEGISAGSIWLPRAYFEAVAARARGDAAGAQTSFTVARAEVEETMRAQPDYAQGLIALGLIDAGLNRKEDALREGTRASVLIPIAKDAIDGADLMVNLAIIYAGTGEKDLALKQLAEAARLPTSVNYGGLRLQPDWDPLRGDPRFEKLVAELAPKDSK